MAAPNHGGEEKPLKFVRRVPPERHCVLFYENDAYAKEIEFTFIESGLAKDERCFYIIHSEQEEAYVKERMKRREALRRGLRTGRLTTFRDSFLPEDPSEVPKLVEERRRTLKLHSIGPTRLVGITLPEITNERQLAVQTRFEVLSQRSMIGSSRTVLCSYPYRMIAERIRNDWFLETLSAHHSAVFAPEGGEGIAFDMR